MTITSPHNDKLKEVRKLRARRRERERTGRFIAEGEDLLAAADAGGWPALERLCAEGSGLPGDEVSSELLAGASELGSGTRSLAIYAERWAPAPVGPLAVYVHGVADPGNVGSILRSAEAFGASSIVLGPGSADPFGPKAVRASMGAIFAVPVVRAAPDDAPLPALPGKTVALTTDAETTLGDLGLELAPPGAQLQAATLIIGSERDGLPKEVVRAADHSARIPIANHSLNAAVAAAIALYELTRRIPTASGPPGNIPPEMAAPDDR